jgi:hypothetical protein
MDIGQIGHKTILPSYHSTSVDYISQDAFLLTAYLSSLLVSLRADSQQPPQQETHADLGRAREVELIAQSGSKHKVVQIYTNTDRQTDREREGERKQTGTFKSERFTLYCFSN